jgi:hypothetical protein
VWPGKLLTPKSAHAVLANVDHQVQAANPVMTAPMVRMVKMAIKEDQAKMPPKKKNYCQFHLNANAKLNPVHRVQLVPKELMAHLVMQAVQAVMVNPDHKDHPAHLVQLVPLALLVLLVQKEKMVN